MEQKKQWYKNDGSPLGPNLGVIAVLISFPFGMRFTSCLLNVEYEI